MFSNCFSTITVLETSLGTYYLQEDTAHISIAIQLLQTLICCCQWLISFQGFLNKMQSSPYMPSYITLF